MAVTVPYGTVTRLSLYVIGQNVLLQFSFPIDLIFNIVFEVYQTIQLERHISERIFLPLYPQVYPLLLYRAKVDVNDI